ncbi:MAG TPA: hypothetical protein VLD38_03930 [Nitrosopumilaceae archaeon]|nr:hypothetical protein [Nitrosopumilaceae archaeon]
MTTKIILSLAVAMFAITGMMGFGNQAFAGNGAGGVGSGGYQLNLVGMNSDDKLTNDEKNSGHRIFVPLDGTTRILLSQGDFKVLDSDGTDGVAKFQLPDPGDCNDVDFNNCTLDYSVYMRVLGKPSDSSYAIVTCATENGVDLNGDGVIDEVCSVESVSLPSSNGAGKNAKFTNVSKELLTVCIDTNLTTDSDGNGITTDDCNLRAELFDDQFINYLWEVDANGHRLAQLRFISNPLT